MFIGREKELTMLEEAYNSNKSELVAICGRRRIGKSALINKFSNNKFSCLHFEGLEGEKTIGQIEHFKTTLSVETNDSFINKMQFESWQEVFLFLTEKFIEKRKSKQKLIISFDEIQWMAVQKGQFISIIKYFWDKYWKYNNVMLILCGSIASFMINKVLKSKALYGRISLEILLRGLSPREAVIFFESKRGYEEILQYFMVFGGVPKYFEEIQMNKSFNQNINRLCFSENGLMTTEIERMFYSQFREARTYLKIVRLLKEGLFSLKEIGEEIGVSSGGSLLSYLKNLENADMIQLYIPFNKNLNTKIKKYTLSDEFLRFYFKFIEPNMKMIQSNKSSNIFETLCEKQFIIWSGFAFEKFCIKNNFLLAELMGFSEKIISASPYFGKNDSKFQIDLLFLRSDKVITLCEIKYRNSTISTKIIQEVERKVNLLKVPRGYTVEKSLISLYGSDKSLRDSGYFHHEVTLEQILK
ncbi:MAG: ATP-binding protein [Spirochaetota bacterium]|nr:ATP-binding protein [Spirochaetota bacterium]